MVSVSSDLCKPVTLFSKTFPEKLKAFGDSVISFEIFRDFSKYVF